MKLIPFFQKLIFFVIIVLQLISCIWYVLTSDTHAHVPGGFIEMIIFGGITLFLSIIALICHFIYKPSGIVYKIPFIIAIGMIVLAWVC